MFSMQWLKRNITSLDLFIHMYLKLHWWTTSAPNIAETLNRIYLALSCSRPANVKIRGLSKRNMETKNFLVLICTHKYFLNKLNQPLLHSLKMKGTLMMQNNQRINTVLENCLFTGSESACVSIIWGTLKK